MCHAKVTAVNRPDQGMGNQFNERWPGQILALGNAPGSGATITIPGSGDQGAAKWMYLALNSSHDSAANGVTAEGSWDGGVTWRVTATDQYLATDGFTLFQAPVVAPLMRWRYVNSANVLTTWDGMAFATYIDLVKV